MLVDIELAETETFELLHIPAVLVQHDTDEHTAAVNDNKKYQDLIANKIGSDSYTDRGAQTLNLVTKSKECLYQGFLQEHK